MGKGIATHIKEHEVLGIDQRLNELDAQVKSFSNQAQAVSAPGGGGGEGGAIAVQDEGMVVDSNVSTLNFTGPGVSVAKSGAKVNVTIPGGAGTGGVAGPETSLENGIPVFVDANGNILASPDAQILKDENGLPFIRLLGNIMDGEQTYTDFSPFGITQNYIGGGSTFTMSADITGSWKVSGPMAISMDGTANPGYDSMLDIASTTRGVRVFPLMTTAQRNAIYDKAIGLMVYDISLDPTDGKALGLCQYNGTSWDVLRKSGGGSGGSGSVVVETDTLTGATADPAAYNSGDFLYNTVYRKLWLNVAQAEWHLMSGGSGTPGIYSATYTATY